MISGIIGKKLGMTQVFTEDGRVTPVTVIEAGPCAVIQKKTVPSDGYDAVQIGFLEVKEKKANKPMAGHFKKSGTAAYRHLREFKGDSSDMEPGSKVTVEIFAKGRQGLRHRDVQGQGFPGRHQAPPLQGRRRDSRLDVPQGAGRHRVVRMAFQGMEKQEAPGPHGRQPGHHAGTRNRRSKGPGQFVVNKRRNPRSPRRYRHRKQDIRAVPRRPGCQR